MERLAIQQVSSADMNWLDVGVFTDAGQGNSALLYKGQGKGEVAYWIVGARSGSTIR
jgi:hypothetical protein